MGETENLTSPFPDPPPEVILIHETPLVAVQEHPGWDVTLIVPVPPPERKDWLVGEIVYVQELPVPDSVTVNEFPAMVRVPVREVLLELITAVGCAVINPVPGEVRVRVGIPGQGDLGSICGG